MNTNTVIICTVFLVLTFFLQGCGTADGEDNKKSNAKLDGRFISIPSPSSRVTLKAKTPISEIVSAFNSKGRIRVNPWSTEAKTALEKRKEIQKIDLTEVPSWEAVVEISRRSGLGISPCAEGAFLTTELKPPVTWATSGPFLLVVEDTKELNPGNGNPGSKFSITPFFDVNEVPVLGREPILSEVIFSGRNKSTKTRRVALRKKKGTDIYEPWVGEIPSGLWKQNVSIKGKIKAVVRSKFVRCRLPGSSFGTAMNNEVSLSIAKSGPVDQGKGLDYAIHYGIRWKSGLSKDDEDRIADIARSSLAGKAISKENLAWFVRARARMRHVELVSIKVYGPAEKQKIPSMYEAEPTPITEIQGKLITSREVLQHGHIEFVWADANEKSFPFQMKLSLESVVVVPANPPVRP